MKFLHTSDLHIGKMVNGFSMLEEQVHALEQMTCAAKELAVDAVFLSGDLYDRSIPGTQAVAVLDEFLTGLVEVGIPVFAIAGNHDSGERIGFANRILEKKGLYMEGVLRNPPHYVDLESEGKMVRIHMVPYAKPAEVRALYGVSAVTYEDCMQAVMAAVTPLEDGINILLAHQFVVNQGREPELSDSETRVSVGGADQVEVGNFRGFDYVALGHIHGKQQIGDMPVYYSGSPVKYSFSEVHHQKAVLYGTWDGDGTLKIKEIPLTPIHDMRKIRGKLTDLISDEAVQGADPEDYLLAVLTNEEELIDPIGTLRSVYPRVMQLQIERISREGNDVEQQAGRLKEKTPYQLFEDFFGQVTGKELGEAQREIVEAAVDQAKEEMG